MHFDIFTLHPDIFNSFEQESLIARGINKQIISIQKHNFRDFGVGNYKAVDDKPFGGGSGMVLRCEPICEALKQTGYVSSLFQQKNNENLEYNSILPNNSAFEEAVRLKKITNRKVNIMLTPRGFPLKQKTCEWLSAEFDSIGIVCGRYEGFDARVSSVVDLELSIGDFVLNGGEVAAMCLIEGVSRLIPNFITKAGSVTHDSFSSELNEYLEQQEYIIGKKKLQNLLTGNMSTSFIENSPKESLFNNKYWLNNILPYIEHPQFTRPENWMNYEVPKVLLSGDHKKIDKWRKGDWYNRTI